jgi:hypothetical protein
MKLGNKGRTIKSAALAITIILSLMVPSFAELPSSEPLSSYELAASQAVKIARVTGETQAGETLPNPNQTRANFALGGTDLGIVWDATTDPAQPKVMIAFGDSFDAWGGFGGGGSGWRGNVLALSEDDILSDGLSFTTMVSDPQSPNYAKEVIYSAHNTSGNDDFTAIPTAGISVGTRHFIHYMQIRSWGAAGRWNINFSEIAYSDDDGQNWIKSGVKWGPDSKFGQAAFIKNGGYVYMFGTPAGRFDGAYLARVAENDMLVKEKYEYWNGAGWVLNNEAAAALVIEAPVAELSVAYNSFYDKFIMTYLNEDHAAIVLRSSSTLTGGWSGEAEIAKGSEYPGLYGAFIHPWSNDGRDLYFLMSQWGPYNVFLMHSTLDIGDPARNLISDASFENQTSGTISAPWILESGNGGIDRATGSARGGKNNVWLRNATGWNCIRQAVTVTPNTEYRLIGFVKTSQNNSDGYFGVRDPAGNIIKEVRFGRYDDYSKQTVQFNSGSNTSVTVFIGMWAGGDTWIQVDNFYLLKVDTTPPVITLTGDASIELSVGEAYVDEGAVAVDNLDGDISRNIVVSGSVNNDFVGTYTLTYNVTDSDGNAAAPVTRTVTVTGDEYFVRNAVFNDSDGNILTTLPKKGFVIAHADITSNTSTPVPVTVVLVLYNKKGEIENVSGVTQSVSPGATETISAGFMMPGDNSGYTARLYVANSLTELLPLSNIASIEQKD